MIVRRIAWPLRAGTCVGLAGANGGGVLREGRAQGGPAAAAVTAGACTLPRHPARAAVQADGRRRERGATVGRHGRRPQGAHLNLPRRERARFRGYFCASCARILSTYRPSIGIRKWTVRARPANRGQSSLFLIRAHDGRWLGYRSLIID